jgi:formate hydrogenlyase transcriptional activator
MAAMPATTFSFPQAAAKRENEIIGADRGLRHVLDAVRMVAPADTAVMIHGETGAGKEVIARAIHEQSRRSRGPYVKINCAAIPAGLLESELFGHERGAYTGAWTQTTGRFQLADGGTLFLDEVGDLPLELQPKLLRILQEQEFERLGSGRTIRVDVRVIAATNRDLEQMVRERQFRADLYYRLNVFPILVPPLRERSEDIPQLVWHFVRRFAERMNKDIDAIPDGVMELLKLHDWPGNIRELQNSIERAVILSSSPVLHPPLSELKPAPMAKRAEAVSKRTLADAQREHIVEVIREAGGMVGGRGGAPGRRAHNAALSDAQARHRTRPDPQRDRLSKPGSSNGCASGAEESRFRPPSASGAAITRQDDAAVAAPLKNVRRSELIWSALVVGIPCGKPG